MIPSIAKALRVGGAPCVAFVGAGGKTTALFALARDLVRLGSPAVLVSTTTHLAVAQASLADQHIVTLGGMEPAGPFSPGITLVTGPARSDERLPAPSDDILIRLQEIARSRGVPFLLEADGSRMKPLKAPAAYEPAIPGVAATVVVAAGLSGLGQPLGAETVHRPERFAELGGLCIGDPVPREALVRVLLHAEGGLKNIPAGAERTALLTQASTDELQAAAARMARALLAGYDRVLVTRLGAAGEIEILAAHENIAGVVLAAGGASRYGSQKLLLPWRGEPLVRHTARTALAAGLEPVRVVAGGDIDAVAAALVGLDVQVVHNPHWEAGQSTSVKAGLAGLPAETGGAVFLLADQPQVPVALVQSLVEEHTSTLAPVIAPIVDGQRGNPVLFDRVTFDDLLKLTGDQGGRGVFSKHRVAWLPWHDRLPLLDVDTPADYARLQELE